MNNMFDACFATSADEAWVVLAGRAPAVRADRDVAQRAVAHDVLGVAAEAVPVAGDGRPARREPTVDVAVGSVGDVLGLAEVDGLWIVHAVVRIVADGLHVVLLALLDHEGGVLARARGQCQLEEGVVVSVRREAESGSEGARRVACAVATRYRGQRDTK